MTLPDPGLRVKLDAYITGLFAPEDANLHFAREEAERQGMPAIHIAPGDGRLLELLARAVQARRILEIGTLAGYSALWMLRALPPDGVLYTLEGNPHHAAVARRVFEQAGIAPQTRIIVGDALNSLDRLAADSLPLLDMVFIDADKGNYPVYLNWAADHLRPNGIVAAHNALRRGRVLQPKNDDDRIIRDFNVAVAEHPDLSGTILNVGDGMLIAIKHG